MGRAIRVAQSKRFLREETKKVIKSQELPSELISVAEWANAAEFWKLFFWGSEFPWLFVCIVESRQISSKNLCQKFLYSFMYVPRSFGFIYYSGLLSVFYLFVLFRGDEKCLIKYKFLEKCPLRELNTVRRWHHLQILIARESLPLGIFSMIIECSPYVTCHVSFKVSLQENQ